MQHGLLVCHRKFCFTRALDGFAVVSVYPWMTNRMLNTHELVGGLEHVLFFHILGIIIPLDFHIFQRGRYTTNQ